MFPTFYIYLFILYWQSQTNSQHILQEQRIFGHYILLFCFQVIILTDVPLLIFTILTPRLKCTNTAWTGTISLPPFPHFVKNVCVDRPDSLSLPSCSQYDVTSQSLIICHHRTTVSVTAIQHRTLAQKKNDFLTNMYCFN